VVVASIVEPEFRHGLVDRVLAQADRCGLHARLVMTKADLAGDAESHALLEDYRAAGIATHVVSTRTRHGIEPLRHECHGRRSLFVGHSGVGKSSLLNELVPGLDLLAGVVNEKTLKGRHTTTAAWMVRPEPDFELIDTPGIRAFGLWGVPSGELERHYPELRSLLGVCRFLDCAHETEPGCSVRDAVKLGAMSARRYDSFVKLRAELRDEEQGEERVRPTTRWRR
jgi:ribosome biogenesis GTPase